MKISFFCTLLFITINLISQTIITFDEDNSPLDISTDCLLIDSKENIWVGSHKYDGTDWTNYGMNGELLSSWINVVYEDSKGVIWFGMNDGISKFDGTHWENLTSEDGLPEHPIRDIIEDLNEIIWIATDKGGVVKIENNEIVIYSEENGFPSSRITSIAVDSENTKWFGTYSGADACGLIKFNSDGWKPYTMNDGLPTSYINDVAVDSENNVWVGTDYAGVSKFDGTNFTTYTEADGLTSDGVYAVCVDKNDNIWLGTHTPNGKTVCKFDGDNWTSYSIYKNIEDLAIDTQDNVWAAASRYLYKIELNPTSIPSNKLNGENFIYNKVSEQISTDIKDLKSLRIFDLQGRLLAEKRNKVISISNLPTGVFIILATDAKGLNYTKKFIK